MLIVLGLAAALTVSDPDGVVATAPAGAGAVPLDAEAPASDAPLDGQAAAITPHNLTTQQQIDRWLSARDPAAEPFADDGGPVDDRRMHGFVSGTIGTNDFSQVAVGVSIPVGETGRVDLAYSRTRNGWYGYGPYDGYGYGYGDFDGPYPFSGYGGPFRQPWRSAPLTGSADVKRRGGQSLSLSYQSDDDDDRPRRPFDRW